MNHRDAKGRGLTRLHDPPQFVQRGQRLAPASGPGEGPGVGGRDVRARTQERLGALHFLDGSIGHALGDVGPPRHDMGQTEVRSELERLFERGNGLVVATGEVADQPKVQLCRRRHRVQTTPTLGQRERLLGPPHGGEIEGIVTEGRLVVRVQVDGAPEMAFGFGKIPVVIEIDRGHGIVRFPEPVVELECFQRGGSAGRVRFPHRQEAIATQQHVRIGQTAVGECVGGIQVDSLVKVLLRLFVSLGGVLRPVMTSA